MGELDVKAYLWHEDHRMQVEVDYAFHRWECTKSLEDLERYEYALMRQKQFIEFRKAVLACFDIKD